MSLEDVPIAFLYRVPDGRIAGVEVGRTPGDHASIPRVFVSHSRPPDAVVAATVGNCVAAFSAHLSLALAAIP